MWKDGFGTETLLLELVFIDTGIKFIVMHFCFLFELILSTITTFVVNANITCIVQERSET